MALLFQNDPKYQNAFVVNNISFPETTDCTSCEQGGQLVIERFQEASSAAEFHNNFVNQHGHTAIVMPQLEPQQYLDNPPLLAITYKETLLHTLQENWNLVTDKYNTWITYPEQWCDRAYENIRAILAKKNYLNVSRPGELICKVKPGIVMGYAQHPHLPYIALATITAVALYAVPYNFEPARLLWHESVKNINCVSFRPNAGTTVAAGYKNGIVLFKVKSVSHLKEFSTAGYHAGSDTYVSFLNDEALGEVHSLSWDSTGDATSGKVGVWKLAGKQFSLLSHVGPVELVLWCPFSDIFFTSHAGRILNFWDNYNKQEYTNMKCQAAAFSPDGKFLAVATNHIHIFSVGVVKGKPEIGKCVFVEPNAHFALFSDGSKADLQEIECLAWSPDGDRLGITFNGLPMVALYTVTQLNQSFSLAPVGYVNPTAYHEESPPHIHAISFLPNFDKGSILCVAYSSAIVAFTPLYYQPTSTRLSQPAIPLNSRPAVLSQPTDQTPRPTTPSPAPSPISGPILSPIMSPGYKVLYNEPRRYFLDNIKSPAFNLGH